MKPLIWGLSLAFAFLATLFVGVAAVYGVSPAEALYRLRGEVVTYTPRVLDVGNVFTGESGAGKIRLTNHTDRDIQVAGGTSNCGCVVTDDLPVTIPAHGELDISVKLFLKGAPNCYEREFTLFLDNGAAIGGKIRGCVVTD